MSLIPGALSSRPAQRTLQDVAFMLADMYRIRGWLFRSGEPTVDAFEAHIRHQIQTLRDDRLATSTSRDGIRVVRADGNFYVLLELSELASSGKMILSSQPWDNDAP